ncbi:hypothetical protein [Salinibacter ruber]|uniref:hypothetical protein n=1 Tax=Salinibacter ruber TaxID=146919 RepID=UPI002073F22E|nr:hypothetical protein [Salinibacter ruber]
MSFDYLNNATLTARRTAGTRGPEGYTEESTTTVFQGRCDAQLSGRILQRKRDLHEEIDAVCFVEDASSIQPGDSAELTLDDGQALEGTVVSLSRIDDSVLVSL